MEPAFLYSRKVKESEFLFGTLYKIVLREESKYTGYYDRLDMSFGAYIRLPGDAIIPTFNLLLVCFIIVPPQPNSTSSGWAPKAKTSNFMNNIFYI